jgi:hypothetical protein
LAPNTIAHSPIASVKPTENGLSIVKTGQLLILTTLFGRIDGGLSPLFFLKRENTRDMTDPPIYKTATRQRSPDLALFDGPAGTGSLAAHMLFRILRIRIQQLV